MPNVARLARNTSKSEFTSMITANLSRSQVQNQTWGMLSSRPRWLISINDAKDPPAVIKDKLFEKVLVLHFDDIEKLSEVERGFKRMSADQLLEMVTFINEAKWGECDLFVHCAAGMCRSGAVVEVLKMLGWQVQESMCAEPRIPNLFVFNNLRKAFGFTNSWECAENVVCHDISCKCSHNLKRNGSE